MQNSDPACARPCGGALLLVATLTATLLPAQATPAPDAPPQGGGWRIAHLDVAVDANPAKRLLAVHGTMQLRAPGGTRTADLAVNVRELALEWVSAEAPDGVEVELNVRHPRFDAARIARLTFATEQPKDELVDVAFRCKIARRSNSFYVGSDIAFTSWVAGWHPFPVPAPGEGFGSHLLAAPGRTTLRFPEAWCSLSNGTRKSNETADGMRTEVWEPEHPVARSWAIGPFTSAEHRTGDRHIRVFRLGGRGGDGAKTQAASVAEAIAGLEPHFGSFPYQDFAVVEVPDSSVTWTASSQQGFILAKSACFRHGRNLPLFAHESSHAWWGNLVGERGPGGILCSESLAQYGAALAIEALEGREAMTKFLRFSRGGYSPLQCARGYFELMRRGHDKPLAQLGSGGWQHDLSDAKGHWVFHMLRRRVGDERYFATMRALIERYSGDEMALDDIRAAFIDDAPAELRLEQFFAQWLERTGAPVLDLDWRQEGDAIKLLVTQEQKGAPYHLLLDLELRDGERRHSARIEIDSARTELSVAAPFAVTEIVLDPGHEVLRWTPEYGDKPDRH